MKIGIVGCGMVAQGHLQAICASDAWQLAGIADIDAQRLEETRAKFTPEHAFPDYRQLLDGAELDALVVATHADTHAEISVAALERGLHVLCEKPMADSLEKCRQMAHAAERHPRCLLLVNFNSRSAPQFRAIKREIDRGVVGRIRVIRIVFNWSCHNWQPLARLETFMANGGPIVESAVHFFEAVRWYTGREFVRIDANGVIEPPYENPQHAIASCLLDDGAIALIETGWLYTKGTKEQSGFQSITVIGDRGTIDFDSVTATIRVWGQEETRQIECSDVDKHFDVVYEKLAESIVSGEAVELATCYDGLKATEAALLALESAKGRPA